MKTGRDYFLEKRIVQYDRWLDKGQISFSARVVPVAESLDARQWILPTEQALEILRDARSVARQDCECRTHYRRCDRPVEVCLLLNEVADHAVAAGDVLPFVPRPLRRCNLAGPGACKRRDL